jgi:hypothetical protein
MECNLVYEDLELSFYYYFQTMHAEDVHIDSEVNRVEGST